MTPSPEYIMSLRDLKDRILSLELEVDQARDKARRLREALVIARTWVRVDVGPYLRNYQKAKECRATIDAALKEEPGDENDSD